MLKEILESKTKDYGIVDNLEKTFGRLKSAGANGFENDAIYVEIYETVDLRMTVNGSEIKNAEKFIKSNGFRITEKDELDDGFIQFILNRKI